MQVAGPDMRCGSTAAMMAAVSIHIFFNVGCTPFEYYRTGTWDRQEVLGNVVNRALSLDGNYTESMWPKYGDVKYASVTDDFTYCREGIECTSILLDAGLMKVEVKRRKIISSIKNPCAYLYVPNEASSHYDNASDFFAEMTRVASKCDGVRFASPQVYMVAIIDSKSGSLIEIVESGED